MRKVFGLLGVFLLMAASGELGWASPLETGLSMTPERSSLEDPLRIQSAPVSSGCHCDTGCSGQCHSCAQCPIGLLPIPERGSVFHPVTAPRERAKIALALPYSPYRPPTNL